MIFDQEAGLKGAGGNRSINIYKNLFRDLKMFLIDKYNRFL